MNYLIDIASIKKLTLIHTNVENSVIRAVLRRAQDMYIEPVLGTAQYDRLLEGVENDDLTAVELTLINDYIAMVLSISVELRIADAITTEIRNIGVGVAEEQNYRANTPNEMERTKDLTYKDLNFYKNRLKRFICENIDDYPLIKDTNLYGLKSDTKQDSSFNNSVVMFGKRTRRR